MVNIALVKKLLNDLRERKRVLEQKKIKDFREFKSDVFLHNAVQHMLEVMVEICVDIGNHMISDEGWETPSSNRDVFKILQEHGVISESLSNLSRKMVGFRNIVVHMYEKVDLEEVYAIYKKNLQDFERFAKEIEKFLS